MMTAEQAWAEATILELGAAEERVEVGALDAVAFARLVVDRLREARERGIPLLALRDYHAKPRPARREYVQ